METMTKRISKVPCVLFTGAFALGLFAVPAGAQDGGDAPACAGLPSHAELTAALRAVVATGGNGGLGNDMWATVVNRDGTVCAVTRTAKLGDQWPGSRVISAQKANTANAFSLEGTYPTVGLGRALSSGNLYGTTQPADASAGAGGSLFGLQFSNPVDPAIAYRGEAARYGTDSDPMVGGRIGGVNVFGGGLALYNNEKELLGGLGVSGDTSCADHVIAWKTRDRLQLDNIPGGVSSSADDNLIIKDPPTPNSFEHPSCLNLEKTVESLPGDFPVGPNP